MRNMKQIKFRVWDKKRKHMVYPDTMNNIMIAISGIVDYGLDSNNNLSNPDLILNQYTGLKDKNGKEIYEGDIVKMTISYPNISYFSECLYLVYWDHDFSCFRPFASSPYECSYTGDYQDARINPQEAEVIGNIDQHPELLNEIKK
jgi:uncharacterized phage protein (TIGR01671 family)